MPDYSVRARLRASAALTLSGHVLSKEAGVNSVLPHWFLRVRSPSVDLTLAYGNNTVQPYEVLHTFRQRARGTRGYGLTLAFFSDLHVLRLFSGGKATPVPLPGTWRAGRILKAFRSASARVQAILSSPTERLELKTELLLRATVDGLSVIGNHDEATVAWSSRIENGTIQIQVDDNPDLQATIVKAANPGRDGMAAGRRSGYPAFRSLWGPSAAGPQTAGPPRARLVFADTETAHGVLTGTVKAGEALADGRIRIRGRLPMIQNLFPLMDRLSELMKTEVPG